MVSFIRDTGAQRLAADVLGELIQVKAAADVVPLNSLLMNRTAIGLGR
jgi:hypothetical protein